MNKTVQRHLDTIKTGVVTKSNVIGVRKILGAAWRHDRGYSVGVTSPVVDHTDRAVLMGALAQHKPLVDAALCESGKRVLSDRRYAKRWSEQQAAIVVGVDSFALVGFEEYAPGAFVPIYMANSLAGGFSFYHLPWQAAMSHGLESGPHVLD